MKKHESAAAATYSPQTFKTFDGALFAFFASECPQLGGDRTRQMLASSIHDMFRRFFPGTDHLEPGQTTWVTVHKDAKGSYGKRIRDTGLTSVVLDLVQGCDAVDRAGGKRLREMKIEAVARLCRQAYEQDGCLTNAELGILLKISPSTVGKYIAEWEMENRTVLPRRGTIHDMGPTLTHKKIIIQKLFIEHKSVQQTARETCHSLPAIQRYIGTFRQVLLCRQKGMNTEETAYALKRTPRLVREYEAIIDGYAGRSYVFEEFLTFKPHIENNLEVWANEYGSRK
jgi:DNA-binding CsgD family transcriptional regulator